MIKKLKSIPLWAKIVCSCIVTIVLVFCGTYILISAQMNKISRSTAVETIPPEDEYFETDTTETATQAQTQAVTETTANSNGIVWPADGEAFKDSDVINILLIGQDRRPGESRARSDSMIIASINKKTNSIKLTSLMRDMYVQIPGYSDNRINSSYSFGGMELLDATILKNFQIQIDGNIEVDFDGFQKVIDDMGGIDIDINQVDLDYLAGQFYDIYDLYNNGHVHMNGAMALAYSRIRYVGNNDYERTQRQRQVLTVVYSIMKNQGLTKTISTLNDIFPLITTDMTNNEILSLAATIATMNVSTIESNRIPVDGSYTSARINEMQVLVPDLTANRTALREIIYGE